MPKLTGQKHLVLMVDDSEDDCLLFKMALRKAERLSFIGSLSDGEEAVAYLGGAGRYSDRKRYPLPDLLLLDLMMPRKDGFEVLEWLRGHQFPDLVVVVLSGSEQPQDIEKALALGAHYFHTKEASPRKRLELVKLFEEYVACKATGRS
jgi:CheY-like chemotaxis protein